MWHISNGKEQIGPLSIEQIDSHIQSGAITRNTIVWRSGMNGWQPVASVPEICHLLIKHNSPPITPSQVSFQAAQPPQQPQTSVVRSPKKNCPYCAEEILEQAIKCKHCGSMLNQVMQVQQQQASLILQSNNQSQMLHNVLSQAASVEDIKKIMKPKKSGGLAIILSLIVIGMGQLYNGDIGKGLVMFILAIVLVPISAGILWFPIAIWSAIDAYSSATNPDERW